MSTSARRYRRQSLQIALRSDEGLARVVGGLAVENVLELAQLANHLLEPLVVVHQQQDGAPRGVTDGEADDALDVEMRVARRGRRRVTSRRDGCARAGEGRRQGSVAWCSPPIVSRLAPPGGTIRLTFSASIGTLTRHGPGSARAFASVAWASTASPRSARNESKSEPEPFRVGKAGRSGTHALDSKCGESYQLSARIRGLRRCVQLDPLDVQFPRLEGPSLTQRLPPMCAGKGDPRYLERRGSPAGERVAVF